MKSNTGLWAGFRPVLCALALLWMAVAFCACGGEKLPKVEVHLEYDAADAVLTNPVSGTRYHWASVSYEPVSVGEAYADVRFGENPVILYRVGAISPERLLTEKFEGVGGLIYEESCPLPALEEMSADQIYVCTMTATETICIEILEDSELIDSVISLLLEGDQAQLPSELSLSLSLKFASRINEGFYYNILYAETGDDVSDGHYFYDRGTRRCVRIPEGMFQGIFYGELPQTETEEIPETQGVTG